MALLDVSDVLSDPDLASTFKAIRKTQVVNSHGRAESTEEIFKNVVGVICSASSNDLERLGDYQISRRYISIVTKFRLQMTSPGMQADTVIWEGSNFVCMHLDPYPQYGQGFVQVIAGSMDSQDSPVPEE